MTTGNTGEAGFRSESHTTDERVVHRLSSSGAVEQDESIDLLELLVTFLAEWKIGLAGALLTMIVGAVYTYTTAPQFVATAVILPKQNAPEVSSVVSIFSARQPEGLYPGLLRSRSVTDNVIRELNLAPTNSQGWEDQRAALQGAMTVVAGPDGLLRISVRSGDAKTAMRIANAYLDGLNQQQKTMALSQSVLNREFYEQQLAREKQALIEAETELEQMQKSSGIIEAGAQTQTGLSEIASVRGQITGLEVQLAALLQSETEENPQVKTLRSQVAQLQAHERLIEANGANRPGTPTAAGRMPEANLEFDRKQRAVRFHEGLLNSLSAQYQNARLVEASSADAFQVVDYAIEPERKAYPPRKTWMIFTAVCAAVLGAFAILFVLLKRRVQADADYQRHMLAMKQNFGFGRR